MALFIALFASHVEENDKAPNEDDDRPCPSPWAYRKHIELLEQAKNTNNKERKSLKPMDERGAGTAHGFLAVEEHRKEI